MIIYNWTDQPVYFRDDPVTINPIVLHKHATYGAWYHNGNPLYLADNYEKESLYITGHWNDVYQYDYYDPMDNYMYETIMILIGALSFCLLVKFVQKLKTR